MLREVWNEVKGGFFLLLIIIGLYYLFQPKSLFGIILLILIPTIIYDILFEGIKQLEELSYYKKLVVMIIVIIIIYYLNIWASGYGVAGFIFMVLAFSIYRLIRAKELILKVMRSIETKVFGAPLDNKKYWKDKKNEIDKKTTTIK